MIYVRWFGLAFGLVGISIQPNYPDVATEQAAWGLLAILALGNLALWGAIGRPSYGAHPERLGFIAFIFDILLVLGFVWVYAFENPYVTWALAFVLPMEGALRYRLKGALFAAASVCVFFIPQGFRVADLNNSDFDVPTYVFVVGLSTLLAGVAGSMAENWHQQAVAFERQSLRLAEVDRLKDRFLAVTSHEIRGPLTAIITGVETVRRRGDRLTAEQNERLLEMVSQQGHQLARLVDDLLITSQLQTGQLELHRGWAELEATIDQALEAAASKRRAHQLEVFIEPLRCEIDASRIGQIVRNLVENAYKYTPDRTRVAVTARAVDQGIVIEVADDGQGIPPEMRDQLFEAFSRIEETAAGQEGVGLGLYVVSQVVAAMEGRIDLASSSRGTTFTIYVPCHHSPAEPPQLGLIRGEGDASY
jgi:signal transduction histidine kinase